jgi:hypothetical protein
MRITQGKLLAQRFYDLADDIDLTRAQALLRERMPRLRSVRNARHLRIPRPPLEMALDPRPAGLGGFPDRPVLVRLYDVGVLAVTFALPLPAPLSGEELITLSIAVQDAEDAITEAGEAVAREVLSRIAGTCRNPSVSELNEDYTIFSIETTEPEASARELAAAVDIPRVLLAEPRPISDEARAASIETFSWDPANLVALSWNGALLYGEEEDVRDLLEVASMQLLEMRAFENEVGRALDHLYEEVESHRSGLFESSRRFQRLSRDIMRRLVDVTEITERVDNSLQWLGDTWYARVHRAAVRVFDIPRWQKQLEHKLNVMRGLNQIIVDQVTTRQSLRLEAAIVLLIVIEILMALFDVF